MLLDKLVWLLRNPARCFQLVESHPEPNRACGFAAWLGICLSLAVSQLGFQKLDPFYIGTAGIWILGGLLGFCCTQKLVLRMLGIKLKFEQILESNSLLLFYMGLGFLIGSWIVIPYPGRAMLYAAQMPLLILGGLVGSSMFYSSLIMIQVLAKVGARKAFKAQLICCLLFYGLLGLVSSIYFQYI